MSHIECPACKTSLEVDAVQFSVRVVESVSAEFEAQNVPAAAPISEPEPAAPAAVEEPAPGPSEPVKPKRVTPPDTGGAILNDLLAKGLREWVRVHPWPGFEPSADLHARYVEWAKGGPEDQPVYPFMITKNRFSKVLVESLGATWYKGAAGRMYGLPEELRAHAEPEVPVAHLHDDSGSSYTEPVAGGPENHYPENVVPIRPEASRSAADVVAATSAALGVSDDVAAAAAESIASAVAANVPVTAVDSAPAADAPPAVAVPEGFRWVQVPGVNGWVLEHDPATQSGLAPRPTPAEPVSVPAPEVEAEKPKRARKPKPTQAPVSAGVFEDLSDVEPGGSAALAAKLNGAPVADLAAPAHELAAGLTQAQVEALSKGEVEEAADAVHKAALAFDLMVQRQAAVRHVAEWQPPAPADAPPAVDPDLEAARYAAEHGIPLSAAADAVVDGGDLEAAEAAPLPAPEPEPEAVSPAAPIDVAAMAAQLGIPVEALVAAMAAQNAAAAPAPAPVVEAPAPAPAPPAPVADPVLWRVGLTDQEAELPFGALEQLFKDRLPEGVVLSSPAVDLAYNDQGFPVAEAQVRAVDGSPLEERTLPVQPAARAARQPAPRGDAGAAGAAALQRQREAAARAAEQASHLPAGQPFYYPEDSADAGDWG
ncbi:hypothetical protein QEH44_gp60 [Arthrobacter phage Shambre1]|uniref:Uncharacterized protein n=1 Tax=Arthrobacter phage Shambre1 TaxID=2927284 RepID=A0A977PT24_9CAUD|nr:hypothetical protein QEH44_gp60 [Arthrobacter phage Shambre1]UXE04796.1 hypothetical protein SEA_SHAMBRE1_60 [Arthrobacter phage Shambre1]